MKCCALSLLLACLGLVTLLLATGCGEMPRGAQVASNSWPDHIDAQLWTDHRAYDFGEPVTVGVTLTNVSKEPIILQSQSGDVPIVDINLQAIRNVGEDPVVFRWSKENPDKIQRTVTLVPGESYVVTWTLRLPVPAVYSIVGWWANSLGRFSMGLSIEYGEGVPNP